MFFHIFHLNEKLHEKFLKCSDKNQKFYSPIFFSLNLLAHSLNMIPRTSIFFQLEHFSMLFLENIILNNEYKDEWRLSNKIENVHKFGVFEFERNEIILFWFVIINAFLPFEILNYENSILKNILFRRKIFEKSINENDEFILIFLYKLSYLFTNSENNNQHKIISENLMRIIFKKISISQIHRFGRLSCLDTFCINFLMEASDINHNVDTIAAYNFFLIGYPQIDRNIFKIFLNLTENDHFLKFSSGYDYILHLSEIYMNSNNDDAEIITKINFNKRTIDHELFITNFFEIIHENEEFLFTARESFEKNLKIINKIDFSKLIFDYSFSMQIQYEKFFLLQIIFTKAYSRLWHIEPLNLDMEQLEKLFLITHFKLIKRKKYKLNFLIISLVEYFELLVYLSTDFLKIIKKGPIFKLILKTLMKCQELSKLEIFKEFEKLPSKLRIIKKKIFYLKYLKIFVKYFL